MRFLLLVSCLKAVDLFGQSTDPDFEKLRATTVSRFEHTTPGQFSSWVKGVARNFQTDGQKLALTFDACGGPNGSGYDEELIHFLRQERIPATLFLSGSWIDKNPEIVRELGKDTLFEIENHGLTHRPCSINGKSRYKIQGTQDVGEVVDEIELNAIKIKSITHRKPLFYRAATATTDEGCARIAKALGETVVSFDVLSGDAVAGTPTDLIKESILKKAHPGAIVIMHMNRPEWNGLEALKEAVPVLREKGYKFVKLQQYRLVGKR